MSEIRGALLIPKTGDPREWSWGYGSRPPLAARVAADLWAVGRYHPVHPHAALLMWDGEANGAGCYAVAGFEGLGLYAKVVSLAAGDHDPSDLQELRDYLEPQGRVVFVDGEGREVAGGA